MLYINNIAGNIISITELNTHGAFGNTGGIHCIRYNASSNIIAGIQSVYSAIYVNNILLVKLGSISANITLNTEYKLKLSNTCVNAMSWNVKTKTVKIHISILSFLKTLFTSLYLTYSLQAITNPTEYKLSNNPWNDPKYGFLPYVKNNPESKYKTIYMINDIPI